MTFSEVDDIICSYGFYCDELEEFEHKSAMYYKYPGIDRLAIYTENFCDQNRNSLDTKHFSDRELNRVDVITFQSIVLWSTGEIGVNYANDAYKLWRRNVHTTQFKLTAEALNKKLQEYRIWLESLLKAQKEFQVKKKLENMETDFDD